MQFMLFMMKNKKIEPTENLDCCQQVCQEQNDSDLEETINISTSSETERLSTETQIENSACENPVLGTQLVDCPWKIKDFIKENLESEFLSHIPVEIYAEQNEEMTIHLKHLYSTVVKVLCKNPEMSEKWVDAYRNLNKFSVSDLIMKICVKSSSTAYQLITTKPNFQLNLRSG